VPSSESGQPVDVNVRFSAGSRRRRFSVVLGKNAMNETDPLVEQRFRVEEIVLHHGFDNSEGNYDNDIGTAETDYYWALRGQRV